jgi:hypothetical protein
MATVRAGAAMFLGLLLLSPARAQQFALPVELQQRVNKAIDDGAAFLKASQNGAGTWTLDPKGHPLGYAALGGLTLLVCGVPADDPVVQRAARFVRAGSGSLDTTYELSLAILFLDKLGEANREREGFDLKKDRKMRDESRRDNQRIEAMALRLVAGQSPSGGWTYRCPVLTDAQQAKLRSALRKKKIIPAGLGDLKALPVLQDPDKLTPVDPPEKRLVPIWGTTDNSNTQFATLAIWTARRHGVPVDRTLRLILKRFETGQTTYGGWPYYYRYGGGLPERPAMTCVGLLGLAIGNGMAQDIALKQGPPMVEAAGIVGGPGLVPTLVALDAIIRQQDAKEAARKAETDGRVLQGFIALDKHVGTPTGRWENLPMANLYFLWSVERVGVLYNLTLLGQKDWYRWGAEILVANQKPPGYWEGGKLYPGSTPPIDTCLALLFLRRANLTVDLSKSLAGKSDDLSRSLREKLAATPEMKETPAPPLLTGILPTLPKAAPPTDTPVEAAAPPPVKAVAATPREDPLPSESGGYAMWFVLLGLVLVVLAGGGIAVFFSRQEREREARPRKRGSKSGRTRMRFSE